MSADFCASASVGDALAERVEGDGDAFVIDVLAGGEDIIDRHAGDEPARHLSSYGRSF